MGERMSLSLELVGKSSSLRNELSASHNAVRRFTTGARRELASLGNIARSVTGQLAAVGVGFSAVRISADSARLDKSLTRIKQTATATAGEMALLRKELFTMARQTGQPLEDLQAGFDGLVQSGLDWKASLEAIKAINVGTGVTGANPETLAKGLTVGAKTFAFDLSKPGVALELLDKMTVAGRLAHSELFSLSDIFARVGVNAASAGMGFDQTLAFIEGLSQVEPIPERLGTLVDSTLRLFNNMKYMKDAQKATGVRFFDKKDKRRDAMAIIGDIKKQYDLLKTDKERAMFIQKAFGSADLDTQKGMRTFLQGDNLADVEKFTQIIKSASSTLVKDLPDATGNMIDQVGMLKNDLREAADGFVKPMNETLAGWIKWARTSKDEGGAGMDGKKMIAGGGGALLAGLTVAKLVSIGAKRLLSGGADLVGGVAVGKALQEAAGVTPVFVTNMPGGGLGGGGVAPVGPAGRMDSVSRFAPLLLGGAEVGALPLATLGAAWASEEIGKKLTDNHIAASSDSELWSHRARQMVMGGGESSYQVKAIDEDMLRRGWDGSRTENKIELNINIDKLGRVTSSSNDPNTRSTINLKRGSFEEALANER
jgi:hypothetical protein